MSAVKARQMTLKLVVYRGPQMEMKTEKGRKINESKNIRQKIYLIINGFVCLSLLPHCPDSFCGWQNTLK